MSMAPSGEEGSTPVSRSTSLGALPEASGTTFRVWAPVGHTLDVVVESPRRQVALARADGGLFEGLVADVGPGDRYRLALDGGTPLPDPASRAQPDGVHGASEVIDPSAFRWSDQGWQGVRLGQLVLYELHVGTFTHEGTFAAVAARLPLLRDLGVTAIELMPLADFAGARNWGYDGAALFAPARCYGRPDDLRRLVDAAHGIGLAVHLDVVYNHFGPAGAYAAAFSPYFFTTRHRSPWGDGINLDGDHGAGVRNFFIENALHWIHEYHVDGLRLDATHAMVDDSPRHFLAELAARVRAAVAGRDVLLIAEDERNLAHIVKTEREGGWSMDAVWADDFHHEMRCLLAGDHEGYFADFAGSVADIATTVRQGWFFTGQYSSYLERPRGSDPAGIPPQRFVICLQNHDQVGNRALGERLHHQVDLASYRAATTLLLCAPETPLLFMGQEWATSAPFCFFTDHDEGLGRLVTEGRRREFARFSSFSSPAARTRIPDPQVLDTFERSRLRWDERDREPHASTLRLYRALLRLRRGEPALGGAAAADAAGGLDVRALDKRTLVLRRDGPDGSALLVAVCLHEHGAATISAPLATLPPGATGWTVVLTSEERAFAVDPQPPAVDARADLVRIDFLRPAAVVLKAA
jgi:maltooligosyltrehalose trehalohydrolase